MKVKTLTTIILLSVFAIAANSQKPYTTTDSEIIFGISDISKNGVELDSDLRFTLFYHTATYLNHDLSNNFGLFYGIALRNVGFITKDESIGIETYSTVKRRSYTIGIPVGFKVGSISDNTFIFMGAEYEWLFHYKEKRFINDEKVYKEGDWFSRQTNNFVPSLFAGVTFPKGYSITFKYYLDDFMNVNYRDALGNRPYSGMNSQVFYISLSKVFKHQKIESIIKSTDYVL